LMSTKRRGAKEETPRSEDYLEVVYHLLREKGYANTSDISSRLNVTPPTVSGMVAKLASRGYIKHERYRGMTLTDVGERVAKSVIKRHSVIAEFLATLGLEDDIAYEDTEGIEHHVHADTIHRIEKTAEYFRKNPRALKALRGYIESD